VIDTCTLRSPIANIQDDDAPALDNDLQNLPIQTPSSQDNDHVRPTPEPCSSHIQNGCLYGSNSPPQDISSNDHLPNHSSQPKSTRDNLPLATPMVAPQFQNGTHISDALVGNQTNLSNSNNGQVLDHSFSNTPSQTINMTLATSPRSSPIPPLSNKDSFNTQNTLNDNRGQVHNRYFFLGHCGNCVMPLASELHSVEPVEEATLRTKIDIPTHPSIQLSTSDTRNSVESVSVPPYFLTLDVLTER